MKKYVWMAMIAGIGGLLYYAKPVDKGGQVDPYFESLNSSIKEAGIERPIVVIDLDALDNNIQEVKNSLNDRLRIITKSLPSIELLTYIMRKTGSQKLMVFHAPFMIELIRSLPADVTTNLDILPGKPIPIAEVRHLYSELNAAERQKLNSVQWLVNDIETIEDYLAFAKQQNLNLRINIEIDVGLHRGGAKDLNQLSDMLAILKQNSQWLSLSGLMGYDGHVIHVPSLSFNHKEKVFTEFNYMLYKYADFKEKAENNYTDLQNRKLTFNGGGSLTYSLYSYSKDKPVNDVSTGSAFLFPSSFQVFTLEKHKPASFIASPVLKKFEYFTMPFQDLISNFTDLVEAWDPNARKSYYVYGGGWPAQIVYPHSVEINTLTASTPNENLLPNQSLYHSSENENLSVGDYVFFWPKQGDAIIQFEDLYLVRNGKLLKEGGLPSVWKTFKRKL
ncbi:MAG: alanine racemase [Leptonema sp. (in: Bacteria)]|nr:alanine racemase [Leptonema sp. (in: bacteria)]